MNQMIIKIERKEKKEKPKKSKKPSKQRKVPMIKVGTHKKLTFVLWVLLIGSVGFGIYKNLLPLTLILSVKQKSLNSRLSIPTK